MQSGRYYPKCVGFPRNNRDNGISLAIVDNDNDPNHVFKIKYNKGWQNIFPNLSNTTKALDIAGGGSDNGTICLQWDFDINKWNQKFMLEPIDEKYFVIRTNVGGKVLDVEGGESATQNGAIIHQWEYLGKSNQQFYLQENQREYIQRREISTD